VIDEEAPQTCAAARDLSWITPAPHVFPAPFTASSCVDQKYGKLPHSLIGYCEKQRRKMNGALNVQHR
jgi:hypothetical protein